MFDSALTLSPVAPSFALSIYSSLLDAELSESKQLSIMIAIVVDFRVLRIPHQLGEPPHEQPPPLIITTK